MIFTSTTRESILPNSPGYGDRSVRPEDPEPWFYARSGVAKRTDAQRKAAPHLAHFIPRAEYRAPANPILVDFRNDPYRQEFGASVLDDYLSGLALGSMEALPEHIEHARKVLARLAALS